MKCLWKSVTSVKDNAREKSPAECIDLAISLMAESKAGLSLGYLDTVILLFRQVLDRRPMAHPLHCEAMGNLASALNLQFMHTNQIEVLKESLTLRRRIREIPFLYDESSSSSSTNITLEDQKNDETEEMVERAKKMLTDFKKSLSLDSLNTMISLLETSLAHDPGPHPRRFATLVMLADGLYSRFHHLSDPADLDRALLSLVDANRCCAQGDWRWPHTNRQMSNILATQFDFSSDPRGLQIALSQLQEWMVPETARSGLEALKCADGLLDQFEQSGNMDNLNTAITLVRRGITQVPVSSEAYFKALYKLANMLRRRFEQKGQQSDLETTLSLNRLSLQLQPPTNPSQPFILSSLANGLSAKFKRGGQQRDLDDCISFHRQALQLLQVSGSPERAISLDNLSAALWRRFEQLGHQDDLDEAISLGHQALELSPARITALSNLGNALWTRFRHGGKMFDLEKAISLLRNALNILGPFHSQRSICLNNLANALWTRFDELGQQSDLDESISLNRQALELRPFPDHNRCSSLHNLACVLTLRFGQVGHQSDLDEAVSLNRQALELRPPSHPERCSALSALASALRLKFEQDKQLGGLEEAILLHKQALDLRPPPHPDRSMSMNSLATAFSARFGEFRQRGDLDESIALLRQAVEMGPHHFRSMYLNNLGLCLWIRSGQSREQNDIDEAISVLKEVLELWPSPHPGRATTLFALGRVLTVAYTINPHNSDYLEKALSLFFDSTHDDLTQFASRRRLTFAKAWIEIASICHHPSEIDAYDAALQALPQVVALSFGVQLREEALHADSDGLARDASIFAIRAGLLDKAIEFLEAGRTIFWSQVLALRSPFEDLHNVAPELADRMKNIATALERGSHRDVSADMLDNQRKLTLDQETFRLNRLNEEWSKGIEEVRRLDGFEDFLRRRRLSSLQAAASSSPVIVLVANQDGGHCLIMTATSVHHIPLVCFPTRMLQELVNLVQIATSRSAISRTSIDTIRGSMNVFLQEERGVRRYTDHRLGSSDDIFKFVLRMLWDQVVKPVIDFLDLQKSGEMPVLHWCPTGLFTFLPIHAAGCYEDTDAEVVGESASDYFISSYTPTISALLTATDSPIPSPVQPLKIMVVIQSQELSSTRVELEKIEQHVPNSALVKLGVPGAAANVESVAARLSDVSAVHFACHGTQNRTKPLDSGLQLDDGILRVSRIMKEAMPNGSFAFLCACETAMGDKNLPDEAISLGASLLFSGFRRVVATMWEIRDEDGPKIADAFYEELFAGGNGAVALQHDANKSAQALHVSVKKLRSKNVPFRRWVPFIHMGK